MSLNHLLDTKTRLIRALSHLPNPRMARVVAAVLAYAAGGILIGALDRIRTYNRRHRRTLLCPVELRARGATGMDSNLRPAPYESAALPLSYGGLSSLRSWWRRPG